MGTDVSTADEWVEIAGFAEGLSVPQSLSGWTLTVLKGAEETVITRFPSSDVLAAGQTLIISNYSKDASRLAQDPFRTSTAMSLPNTKLLLRLRDAQGALIDEVDDGVGNPFAGANPSSNGPKASMERIDVSQPGYVSTNWRTATLSTGFDQGAPIFGTPGSVNSPSPSNSSSSTSLISQVSTSLQFSEPQPSPSSALSSALDFATSVMSSSVSIDSVSSNVASTDVENSMSSIQFQPYIMLKITELLSNPIGSDDAEWIELKNEGMEPVNLSGMTIRVGAAGHRIRGAASGVIIPSGGFMVIPKAIGGFTLTNNGATVELLSGSTLIDTFTYSLMPEGVSAGRSETGDQGWATRQTAVGLVSDEELTVPFCVPTPGQENRVITPDPQIVIQSGNPVGQAPVTLNVSVAMGSGSLAGASCRFDFGDGFTSESCNPPAHTVKTIGDYTIQMTFKNYCGTTVIRSLAGSVLAKPFSVRSTNIPSKGGVAPVCTPTTFSGVSMTELLPNPTGDEGGGEWVELRNDTDDRLSLCGWSLDDGPSGSRPFRLSDFALPARTFLVLPRRQTKIAFNNDHDMVRLIAPLQEGGTGAYQTVLFDHAPDDQSYAVNGSGSWIWTPYVTPGDSNRFQAAASLFQSSPISISAALPNPDGPDTWDEWIELTNSAAWPIWLNGWVIRNSKGKELDLRGTVLAKLQTKRIYLSRAKYALGNEVEALSLVDPGNVVRAILPWASAKEEEIQRPHDLPFPKETVLVRQVLSPDEWVVQLEDDATHLARIRLRGIVFPDDSSMNNKANYYLRALTLNKKVDLQIDTNSREKDGALLASAFVNDLDVQRELLIKGYAAVDYYQRDGLYGEYAVYESMARSAKEGLWHAEELTASMDYFKEKSQLFASVKAKGLSIKFDQKERIIASGTLLTLTPNQPAPLFVSINGGSFLPWSGGILVASNQTIRAYAETDFSEYGKIKSPVIEKTFLVDTSAPKRSVRISEVYPSPRSGETEWIELENRTSQTVSLGGWSLDDAEHTGSKPWIIPLDVSLPPYGMRLFPADVTHISLSNSGDEVRLLYPSGFVADAVPYSSMKKGRAIAWNQTTASFCPTDSATPLNSNTCFIQNKKSTQKKALKKKLNKKKKITKKYLQHEEEYQKRRRVRQEQLYSTLRAHVRSAAGGTLRFSSEWHLSDLLVLLLCTGSLALLCLSRSKRR